MDALIKLIKGFIKSVTSIVDFIVDFFADLVYVIELLGDFVGEIPGYFSWLPGTCVALIGTLFSIVVIYVVVGRK